MPGWMVRLMSVAVLVSGAGCRFNADYGGTDFLCSDGVCPPGKVCIDGHCVDGPADGGSNPDAPPGAADAASDAAIPVAACGTVSLLTDDFEDGVEGEKWDDSYTNGIGMAETGGVLEFTLPAGNVTGSSAYITDSTYDLRGSRLYVEVVQAPDTTATDQETQFVLRTDTNDRVVMRVISGNLEMYVRDDGVQTGLAETPYSPTTHRYWALREEDGALLYETSPDAVDWQVEHNLTPPFALDMVQVQLGAADFTGSTTTAVARFDDVNGGGAPTGNWCKTSSFTDDFDDGVIPWAWSQSFDATGCNRQENGGQAVVDISSGSTTHCAFYPAPSFDLTDDFVQVEIVQMISTSMTDIRAYLRVWLDNANYLDILQEDGLMEFRVRVAASTTTLDTDPFSLATHHFWRLREAAGTLHWETSPDGTNWTTHATMSDPFDLSAIQVGLGGQALTAPATDPGHIRFDRFNQP